MAKTGAVNLDILREIEHDLVGRWPFIWKLVQAASRRGSVRGSSQALGDPIDVAEPHGTLGTCYIHRS